MIKQVALVINPRQGEDLSSFSNYDTDPASAVELWATTLNIRARALERFYAFLVTTPIHKLFAMGDEIVVMVEEEHIPKLLKCMGSRATVRE